jgi:hypothetical protein
MATMAPTTSSNVCKSQGAGCRPLNNAQTSLTFEVPPNRGKSIEDYIAAGDFHMNQTEFQNTYGVDPSRQIRLVKILFMRYQHPGLKEVTTFLNGE